MAADMIKSGYVDNSTKSGFAADEVRLGPVRS